MKRMAWVGFLLVGPKEEACRYGAIVEAGGPSALERDLRVQDGERVVMLDGCTDVVQLFGEMLGPVSLDEPESKVTPLGAFVSAAEKIVVSNDGSVFWIPPEAADSLSAQLAQLVGHLFDHDDRWLSPQVESSAEEQESRARVEDVAEVYDRGGASGVGVVVCLLKCASDRLPVTEREHAHASVRPDTRAPGRRSPTCASRRKSRGN